jgi:hypothetical protein
MVAAFSISATVLSSPSPDKIPASIKFGVVTSATEGAVLGCYLRFRKQNTGCPFTSQYWVNDNIFG